MTCRCQYCTRPFSPIALDRIALGAFLSLLAEYRAIAAAKRFVGPILPDLTYIPRLKNRTDLVTYLGKTLSIEGWAKETGIKVSVLYSRLAIKGWEPARALTTPIRKMVRK